MTDIGELVVRIRADATQLQNELKKTNGIVKQSASEMNGALGGLKGQLASLLPALSVGAFVSFGASALAAADRLNDLSQRTGIAASTLSALNIPLKQSGSSVEDFAASINLMNNAIGEAADGANQAAVKAFDNLGLSVAKLRQLSPEEQFYEIGRALNDLKSQSEFINAGRAIFGRAFASLGPVIRQANGDLSAFVETAKKTGGALTEEQLKRIDDFGDKWTEAAEQIKLSMAGLTPILEGAIEAFRILQQLNPVNLGANLGKVAGDAIRDRGLPKNASYARPDVPSDESLAAGIRASLGMGKASGSNAGLLKPEKNQAADDAKKARQSIDEYIQSLRQENELLGLSERAQATRRAEIEATNIAQKGGIQVSAEQAEAIRELTQANYDMEESTRKAKEAMQEQARFAAELKDKLSDALTSAILDFDSATASAENFARAIANTILQKTVTGPLAEGLIGGLGSLAGNRPSGDFVGPMQQGGIFSGIGNLLGFADGGSPPVGVPSIVGERGPEIFVPKTAGMILPNGTGMGNSVIVQQSITINAGVNEAVAAQIRQAAPQIAAAAHASVFGAMQKGGAESRISGLRK